MSLTFEFCDNRAREAAAAAEEATLDNVRESLLRSEAAWRVMANRLHAVQATRKAIAQDRNRTEPANSGNALRQADWPELT